MAGGRAGGKRGLGGRVGCGGICRVTEARLDGRGPASDLSPRPAGWRRRFRSVWLAGLLRRDSGSHKGRAAWLADSAQESRPILAWTIEAVAFVSSLLVVVAVLAAGTNPGTLGAWGTAAGIGVIMGAAVLFILLVARWQAEWLVYLAQAVMLCAYVDYRLAFPQPIAFDAIVLTLLGYLDLGIAEVLERLRAEDLCTARAVFLARAADVAVDSAHVD